MELILITTVLVGAVMALMAVGVIFGNRCLRGSCGGPGLLGPDGQPLTCSTCPHREPTPSGGAGPSVEE